MPQLGHIQGNAADEGRLAHPLDDEFAGFKMVRVAMHVGDDLGRDHDPLGQHPGVVGSHPDQIGRGQAAVPGGIRPIIHSELEPQVVVDVQQVVVGVLDEHGGGYLAHELAEPLPGFGEIGLRLPALCDVRHGAHHPPGRAVWPPQGDLAAVQDPAVPAVGVLQAVLGDILGLVAGQGEIQLPLGAEEVVRMDPPLPLLGRLAVRAGRDTQHLFPAARAEHPAGAQVPVPHGIAAPFECELPAFLALPQGGLGLLAGRDVPHDRDLGVGLLGVEPVEADLGVKRHAVEAAVLPIEEQRLAGGGAGDVARRRFAGQAPVRLPLGGEVPRRPADDGLAGAPVDPEQAGVAVREPAAAQEQDAVGGRLDERAVARLAASQALLDRVLDERVSESGQE